MLVQTGDQLQSVQAHDLDMQITDLQFSADRTYFITASKDKSAKVRLSPQNC
jgi:translation initiation factor 3 subunit I